MNAASRCAKCLSSAERIDISGSFPVELPVSIAWLRTDDPYALRKMFAKGQAAVAAKNDRALDDINASAGPRFQADEGKALLLTVVLALVARNRVTLHAVSHRPGWPSRLFGIRGDAVIHVTASGRSREDEGAIEAKLIDGVTRGTGPKTPHGPSLLDAVRSMFPSIVSNAGTELLAWAKEDAVRRGVGRWLPKEEIPPPPPTERGGFLYDMVLKMEPSLRHYQILPASERAVDAARAALEEFRRTLLARDSAILSKIGEEVQRGLDARTASSD